MGRHSEEILQKDLLDRLKEIAWIPDFKEHLDWLYHVANEAGANCTAQQLAHRAAMGVVPGIPDLCHPIGFYLELKRPDGKGRERAEQKKFREYCRKISRAHLLTNDINEAEFFVVDQIAKFLGNYRVTRIDPTKLTINGRQTMNYHAVFIENTDSPL